MAKHSLKKVLFLAFIGGVAYLTWATCHLPLPCPKSPLHFYSNELGDDLRFVVLKAIRSAKSSISLQIYGLSDPDILRALQKKEAEGVPVQIFFDKGGSKRLKMGIPIKAGGLMHRKILVIDDALCLVGTANFTPSSLSLHGNAIVGMYSPQIALFFARASKDQAIFQLGGRTLHSYFTPDFSGEVQKALSYEIKKAKKSLHLAMFTLTHKELIEQMVAAAKRGVEVHVAIDRYTEKGSSKKALEQLEKGKVNILVHSGNQLLHHKWALIDEEVFVIGSANWTQSAFRKNQDCLLIFSSLGKTDAKRLKKLWKRVARGCKKR